MTRIPLILLTALLASCGGAAGVGGVSQGDLAGEGPGDEAQTAGEPSGAAPMIKFIVGGVLWVLVISYLMLAGRFGESR